MKITTFIGNGYFDVTLDPAAHGALQAKSERDAIALAAGIADLVERHTGISVTLASEEDD